MDADFSYGRPGAEWWRSVRHHVVSRRILGWPATAYMRMDLAFDALERVAQDGQIMLV